MFEKFNRLNILDKWTILAAYYVVCYMTGALIRMTVDRYKR